MSSSTVAQAYNMLVESIGLQVCQFYTNCACLFPKKTCNSYNCGDCGKLLKEEDIPKIMDLPKEDRCDCRFPNIQTFRTQLLCIDCNKFHRDGLFIEYYKVWNDFMELANETHLDSVLNMEKFVRFK